MPRIHIRRKPLSSGKVCCYAEVMFIFTMLFHLLLLPFTLLRMALGLLGVSSHIITGILLFPLKIFARHTIACLIIAAALILYFALKRDPHAADGLKPQMATKPSATGPSSPKGAPPIIEPVSKREDGDSAFATDAYALMNEQERGHYSANFYKIMSSTPDGRADSWSYYNIHGTLRPTHSFKNNSGTVCRSFSEVLKVHHLQQTISGTACDNGGGTWCKLKPNATPACGLGHSPGALEGISNAIGNLF